MLKTTVTLQVLVTNDALAANKVNGIEGGDKLIEKFVELKTEKLLKSEKLLKNWKLFKSGKSKSEKLAVQKTIKK